MIVGLEPGSDLAEAVEIGAAADVATEVGEEEAVRLFLFGYGVVLLPEVEDAVVEDAPVCRSASRRQLATDRAVTLRQAANRRPAIGVEAVHVVKRVNLSHDCWNIVVHVGGEHAGLEETRLFLAELDRTIQVAHCPLRMGLECISPVEVGAHARDNSHIALLRGGYALSEEVAALQEFAMAMELNLRGIEGKDAGDADKDNVQLRRCASSRPTLRCS